MDEHLVVLDGQTITSKYDFLDNNQKSLEWWTAKHNWYSNKEVLDYLEILIREETPATDARAVSLTKVITSLLTGANDFLITWKRITFLKICFLVIPKTLPASYCPFGTLSIAPRKISEK